MREFHAILSAPADYVYGHDETVEKHIRTCLVIQPTEKNSKKKHDIL